MKKPPKVVIHVLKLQTPEIGNGRWHNYLIKLLNTGGFLDTTRHLFLLDSSPLPPTPAEPLTYWQRERMLNDWLDLVVRDAAANESEYRRLRARAQVRALFRTHGGYGPMWLVIWVDSWSVWPSKGKKMDVTVYVPKEMLPARDYVRGRTYRIPKEPAPVVWKKPDWRGTGSIDEPIAYRLGAWHACKAQYPHAYQTVDIALLSEDESGIWLGRKDNELEWRFFGGFTDPADASLEDAASRELLEETAIQVSHNDLHYISSMRVDDWRYRGQNDKIITAFFMAHELLGKEPVPCDDIAEIKYFELADITQKLFVPEHWHLYGHLCQYLWKQKDNGKLNTSKGTEMCCISRI